MTTKIKAAMTARLDDTSGVERDADGVPTAFRIWRAGVNMTDYGPHTLDATSAKLLMAEQSARGNRYSVDVNHLSLDKTAPLENQRSVGTFAIEMRGGDLWAVDCRWTPTTRAQLARGEWPSISPAYNVDTNGRIVGLTNLALTGTPATWNATQIAATQIAASRTANLSAMPAHELQALAKANAGDLSRQASRELTRRGGASSGDRRLAAMADRYGLGPSRPLVRNEGCRQVFDYVDDPARAREHLRVIASRPPPEHQSQGFERVAARMGVPSARAAVRNEGCRQVFEHMTPDEARAFLAKKEGN